MRAVCLTLFLAGCLDGLPPEDPGMGEPVARGACTALEGRAFQSLQQGECGPAPGACYWRLAFTPADGTHTLFTWSRADAEESGTVTCDNGVIRARQSLVQYAGTYDAANLELVWDDRAYAPAVKRL
jgi:hypothetical protein